MILNRRYCIIMEMRGSRSCHENEKNMCVKKKEGWVCFLSMESEMITLLLGMYYNQTRRLRPSIKGAKREAFAFAWAKL